MKPIHKDFKNSHHSQAKLHLTFSFHIFFTDGKIQKIYTFCECLPSVKKENESCKE